MSTVDLARLPWRKSSRSTGSGAEGNCIEIAFAGPVVAVRDSKNRDADALAVPAAAFIALLDSM